MPTAPQEVLDLARDWVRAAGMRDMDFIAAHSFTEDPKAIHTFASAPGANLTLSLMLDHLGEVPPRESYDFSPEGFVLGDVAWVTDTIKCDMLYDGIIDVRSTVVLVRVQGEWKVAHVHVAEGVEREM